jgi:hypothetical protein
MKLLVLALALQTAVAPQTWFKVAVDGQSISIPAGTVLRYGDAAGTAFGCGTGPVLAAAVWVTPTVANPTFVSPLVLGVTDPAPCYVKEVDVLETASAQTVKVNGASVAVPALTTTQPTTPGPTTATLPLGSCTLTVDGSGNLILTPGVSK